MREFQMNPYFFLVTGMLCLYLLIQAIRAIIETTRNYGHKVNDEPINGLYCKFCGKPQTFAANLIVIARTSGRKKQNRFTTVPGWGLARFPIQNDANGPQRRRISRQVVNFCYLAHVLYFSSQTKNKPQ